MFVRRGLFVLSIGVLGAGSAVAQFIAINMHPAGYSGSEIRSSYGGKQFGMARIPGGGGNERAILWSSVPGSEVSLHVEGHRLSIGNGTDGARQVGVAQPEHPGNWKAAIWSGTPGSYVNLNPAGFEVSEVAAIQGDVQVGRAVLPGGGQTDRAALWNSSAASFVELHPSTGYWRSRATSVEGGFQYGWAAPDNMFPHAARWSGSAASMIEYHPETGFESSFINDVHGGQLAGYGQTNGGVVHALVWSGLPGSSFDLHPIQHHYSVAVAVANGSQVGMISNGETGKDNAALWHGSPGSFVNLHSFLPVEYTSSTALDIDPITGDIVGWAQKAGGGFEAMIWRPVPEPTTLLSFAVGLAIVFIRKPMR